MRVVARTNVVAPEVGNRTQCDAGAGKHFRTAPHTVVGRFPYRNDRPTCRVSVQNRDIPVLR